MIKTGRRWQRIGCTGIAGTSLDPEATDETVPDWLRRANRSDATLPMFDHPQG